MKRVKGTSNVYHIRSWSNVWLADDTLIGTGFWSFIDILHMIWHSERYLSDIKGIFIDHNHRDHVRNLEKLKALTDATVYAHRNDCEYIPGGFWNSVLYDRNLGNYVDEFVDEGDILPIMHGAEVKYFGGHTDGSIGLWLPYEGILFCGDVVKEKDGNIRIPPNVFNVNTQQVVGAREKINELDWRIICPGHGKVIYKGKA